MRSCHQRRPQAGVSLLLEVMLGLGLFATCLLLMFGIFPLSKRSITQAKNQSIALMLAQEKMSELRKLDVQTPDPDLTNGTHPAIPEILIYPVTISGVTSSTEFERTWTVTLNPAMGLSAPVGAKVRDIVVKVAYIDGVGTNSLRHEVRMESVVAAH